MFRHILLAADGEEHTQKAINCCLEIAKKFRSRVTAIHVMDPYLKQFYNEIYAQGRKQYLDHVDTCLRSEAGELEKALDTAFKPGISSFSFITSYGDPEEEILTELEKNSYDLLITGGKILSGIRKLTSWNLPTRLEMKSPGVPVLVCRQ